MTDAKISVSTEGTRFGIELKNIDFSESRDKMALAIGRRIVDGLYTMSEEV